MQNKLSPKKYIETNARKLPIYKCYVNSDWETAELADVFVMRKHSNGNLTVGIYLVDLACLGIKDTYFFFNESELSINEKLHLPNLNLKGIDYHLAHNIVFAGYEYALEFDIKPHSDFAITKFILEEDDDNIPLIDIAVGGSNGYPHLILQPGHFQKYKHVYEKLVKKLGKENFKFTVEANMLGYDGAMKDEYSIKNEDIVKIADFAPGEITMDSVREIDSSEFDSDEKINSRSPFEIFTITIEMALRILEARRIDLFYSEEELDEKLDKDLVSNNKKYPSWVTDEIKNEFIKMLDSDEEVINKMLIKNNVEEEIVRLENELLMESIHLYLHNPLILHKLYERSVKLKNKEAFNILKSVITSFSEQYLSLKLEHALCSYYFNEWESESDNKFIIDGTHLSEIFPEIDGFSDFELNIFYSLRLIYSIRNDNIKDAFYYYNLLCEIDLRVPLTLFLQIDFNNLLTIILREEVEKLEETE